MAQSVLTKPKLEIYIKSSFLKAYKKRIYQRYYSTSFNNWIIQQHKLSNQDEFNI